MLLRFLSQSLLLSLVGLCFVFTGCEPKKNSGQETKPPQPAEELAEQKSDAKLPSTTPSNVNPPNDTVPARLQESPPEENRPQHPTTARVVPVTLGDAVIDYFLQASMGSWKQWKIEPSSAEIKPVWGSVKVDWSTDEATPEVILTRRFDGDGVPLAGYETLVLSAAFTKGSQVHIQAWTDKGESDVTQEATQSTASEFTVPLREASFLKEVTVVVRSPTKGQQSGTLYWLGLRNNTTRELELERWHQFAAQPLDLFLRSTAPSPIAPIYNLLSPPEGFNLARKSITDTKALGLESDVHMQPHLGGANIKAFGRGILEDNGYQLTVLRQQKSGARWQLDLAATEAALRSDSDSLREVAKAALQVCLIPHWDADFVSDFPDSLWTQGAFQQSMTSYHVAIAFDMAGQWLTPAGQELILRRLIDSGLNPVNSDLWLNRARHESNQLPVFTPGRLAVYLIMEKRGLAGTAPAYTDLAFQEFIDTLSRIFESDGGFREGSGYLAYTLNLTLPSLAMYANARGRSFDEVAPPFLSNVDDLLEVLRSTTGGGKLLIAVGSSQGGSQVGISPSCLSVLAKIRPGGAAARILSAQSDQIPALSLWAQPPPDLAGVDSDFYKPWVLLPKSRIAASVRRLDNEWVKLLFVGNAYGAGHYHEDRGSFVLEFAGQTFAADPGGLAYSDVRSDSMKFAQNHNMLVPVSENGKRSAPVRPLKPHHAVNVEGQGDATGLDVSMNPGVLWPDYYKTWKRTFQSSTPSEFSIVDSYQLSKGTGVEFLWHTPLPVTRDAAGHVIITGDRGSVVITPPQGAEVSIEPPHLIGTLDLSTIRFLIPGAAATIETKVTLSLNK